jgi:hypothetical protein
MKPEIDEDQPIIYINEKHKPIRPLAKNVVYIPEPFLENKRRYLAGKEFKTSA